MRRTSATILLCGLTVLATACSKKDDDSSTLTTTATTATAKAGTPAPPAEKAAPAAAAPAAATSVEVSPEMKGFMAMLDGKDASAGNALKKYGIKGLKDADLGMYTLKDPKVVKAEKVGALQCYTMVTAAGMMKHTSKLCWNAAGKIAEVTDTSE
jgi:hypothetical protein